MAREAKDKAISVRFTKSRVDWLKDHAASLRRSITSILEEALDDYKARHESKPGQPKPKKPA